MRVFSSKIKSFILPILKFKHKMFYKKLIKEHITTTVFFFPFAPSPNYLEAPNLVLIFYKPRSFASSLYMYFSRVHISL